MNVTQMVTGTTRPAMQRRAQIAQEQPDDEAGEKQPDDDGVAHAADRFADDVRTGRKRRSVRRPREASERRLSISWWTSSATSTVLLSGWRLMLSSTAGLPFAVTTV